MKLQLIRNATMRIDYAGKSLLTDPMLCARGALFTIAGVAPNPIAELPFPAEEVAAGVDCVVVSHDHADHFDRTATGGTIPRTVPLFCQPGEKEKRLWEGFRNVITVDSFYEWEGIRITRRSGRHGEGRILRLTGEASGYVLQAGEEPTVYWAGDSVWCREVEDTITEFDPDVIITHSGGGSVPGLGATIMDGEQTLLALGASSAGTIVAVHMEAMDHCRVSRRDLRRLADEAGIPGSRLLIPGNGEVIML